MKEICMPKDKNTINSTLEFLINNWDRILNVKKKWKNKEKSYRMY